MLDHYPQIFGRFNLFFCLDFVTGSRVSAAASDTDAGFCQPALLLLLLLQFRFFGNPAKYFVL